VVDAMEKLVVRRFGVIDLNGNAVREDRFGNERLRIRHGIQRLASPSTRVEDVEENELPLRARTFERSLVIGLPRNE
jgi:hypothetical protein